MFNSLEQAMKQVEVESCHYGYWYSVSDVLLIMVSGLLSGLKDIEEISEWSRSEIGQNLLISEFNITKAPCRSHFYTILRRVNYEAFRKYFMMWMQSLLKDKFAHKTISIDGKTIRSTDQRSADGSALHIASALISEYGFVIASKECQTKTGEITVFRELVQSLDVKGTIVVADALHCNQKSAEVVVEAGGSYLFSVKNNNKHLRESIEIFSYNQKTDEYTSGPEKNGGRIETRTAYLSDKIELFSHKDKWKDLACVGAIHREVEKQDKKTSEWHYYICSKKLTAKELLEHARFEWQVESMHWVLDVHFLEDDTKLFDMNLQKNMNILRKIVYNLTKQYKTTCPKNTAISRIFRKNLFNLAEMQKCLGFLRNCKDLK